MASGSIKGPATNINIGDNSMSDIGDVNGDGRDDVLVNSNGSQRGAFVVFTPKPNVSLDAADLAPGQGYRIAVAGTGATNVESAGDQNGDGITDFLIRVNNDLVVVFGTAAENVASLPLCGATNTRCVNVSSPLTTPFSSTSGGYLIKGGKLGGLPGGINNFSAGDFNGDSKDEIVVGMGPGSTDSSVVLPNGLTPVDGILDLTAGLPTGTVKLTGITGPFTFFGLNANFVGDVNGDGKDDLAALSSPLGSEGLDQAASTYVVYGTSTVADIDVLNMQPTQGYRVTSSVAGGLGDQMVAFGLDGYGGPDRSGVVFEEKVTPSDDQGNALTPIDQMAVTRAPSSTDTATTIETMPFDSDYGYRVLSGDAALTGSLISPGSGDVGDLNGDGVSDFAQGVNVTVDGQANSGRLSLLLTQQDDGDVTLGASTSGADAITLLGAPGMRLGLSVEGIGDIDGDGIADLAVGGRTADGSTLGAVYFVRGRDLLPNSRTGAAVGVTHSSASLNGAVSPNGRSVNASFEYGTSDSYGSTAPAQSVDSDGYLEPVDADVSGLEPETTYHYRVVATNELGATRYGADRTFTTPAEPAKQGCEADDTKPGCEKYKYCEDAAHANEAVCQAPIARLSGLIVSPASSKVKRGKKTVVRATVVNTGGAAASDVRICAAGPKKLVTVKKSCVSLGSLESGASKTAKFTVAVKRRAKRGGKAAISVSATATGLDKRSAKVTVRVR